MILWKWFVHLVFPPRCVLCNKPLNQELDLCRDCRIHEPQWQSGENKRNFIDSWLALWYYEGRVPGSLSLYKFRGRRSKVKSYGRLLAMKIRERYPDGLDALTWIPVSRRRKLSRGYDQVQLLAKEVGKQLQMKPMRLLKKVRHNPPQSGIKEQAVRKANVLGVYKVTDPRKVAGKTILLLDDIITTGATASEAARMLMMANAKQVHFAAVAAARRGKNK